MLLPNAQFKQRNSETYEQVMTDLARLGSQLAYSNGQRSKGIDQSNKADNE